MTAAESLDWEYVVDSRPTDTEAVAGFTDTFPINPIKYGLMTAYNSETGKKSSTTENKPARSSDIVRHLNLVDHKGRIGYLPGLQDTTKVGVIDIDLKDFTDQSNFEAAVSKVVAAMDAHGIYGHREDSTNGGAHLWVFLSEALAYADVRKLLKILIEEAGLPKLETFPKGNNASSNWIYLPYAGANVHPENLGLTFLQDRAGKPVPLRALVESIERTPMSAVVSLLAKQPEAADKNLEQSAASDLDPEKFSLLADAALTPPDRFERHNSLEAFLNVAERMGKQAEMAVHLKSQAVYDAWANDDSRTLEAWESEIDRWLEGKSGHQYGIKFLLDQGWKLPDFTQATSVATQYKGKQSWQQGFDALRLKYAPHIDDLGKAKRIRRYRAHEVNAVPQLTPLVGNLLVQHTLAALLGSSGVGKSMVGLDMALHVATGRAWHGQEVVQGAVVWLAAESMEYTAERMEAWCDMHSVEPQSLPFDLLDGYLSLTDVAPDGGLEELIQILQVIQSERGPLAMIVVDTVARTFGDGDENSNDDMKHFTDAAELLTRVFSSTVLLIHHTGKDISRGGRGASAFKAPLTTELILEKKGNVVQLAQSKNRGGAEDARPLLLRFDSHSWDVGGTTRTSGVVAEASGLPELTFAEDMLSPQQRDMFRALIDLAEDTEEPIKRKAWQAACEQKGIDRRRFNDNLKTLLDAKVVREVITGKTYRPSREEDE